MNLPTLNQLLDTLENDLQACQLWATQAPSPEQLSSQEPFCVDTMPFEQWLQWLFIPRMREMVNQPNFNGLPHRSDIHTMADYIFQPYEQQTDNVVQTIKQIDDAINDFGQPVIH